MRYPTGRFIPDRRMLGRAIVDRRDALAFYDPASMRSICANTNYGRVLWLLTIHADPHEAIVDVVDEALAGCLYADLDDALALATARHGRYEDVA